ncbi:ATP-binding protein [Kitasatospora sp. NPDC088346]|uniref:ATP-binding protein n=1 Tax=Kitasatospora sp. NPDC088346 TaxID=3364073 RepID=UPI0037F9D0E1
MATHPSTRPPTAPATVRPAIPPTARAAARPPATVRAAQPAAARPPAPDVMKALLPYEPRSAAEARRLVRTALAAWGLEELADAGEVVVSELAGNAVRTGCHRSMAVTVERITEARVRISVRDGSRTLPCLIDAGPDAESGRGMALIHHLTAGQWGATPEPYGKTVHADLRTRPPHGPEPAGSV